MMKRMLAAMLVALVLVVSPVATQAQRKEKGQRSPQLYTLVGALTKALVGTDTLTLFAPTDAAFSRSGVSLEDLTPAQLKQVLAYHVVPGAGVLSSALSKQQMVPTAQGGNLNVRKDANGVVTVNGAKVVYADMIQGKAVVHFIDQLLVPLLVSASPEPAVVKVISPVATDEETTGIITAPMPQLKSIVENAVDSPSLAVLVSVLLLPEYSSVLQLLSGEGPFTVFAPTNEAFVAAGVDPLDVAAVTEILKFHVVPGVALKSTDLKGASAAETLQGSVVPITKNSQGDVTVLGANVVAADVLSTNGVVHLIDRVLIPPPSTTTTTSSIPAMPKSIVQNAMETQQLSVLVSVLTLPEYKPVLDALSGSGPFTVFAPTNDAFEAAGVNPQDVAAVTEVLKFHVVPGLAVESTDLSALQAVDTLQGSPILVRKSSQGVTVNNANVLAADVISSNGVVHIIDSVLIPPPPSTTPSSVLPLNSVQPSDQVSQQAFYLAIIDRAIEEGAPLYNQGDVEGTARLYRAAALQVARGAMGSVKDIMDAGLLASSSAPAEKTAWLLRAAFDAVRNSPMPDSSIVENAVATPEVSTLVSVLTTPAYAPVLSALSGNGPFTVFAPSNAAFAAAGVDTSNVAAVTEVLKYHVVPAIAYSVGLASIQNVPTLEGSTLRVVATNNNRDVRVNNARVVAANVLTSNGVIHIIDQVLMPSTSSATVQSSRAGILTTSLLTPARSYATLGAVQQRLEEAIALGAPMYDAGDREGCKQVYIQAANELIAANAPMSASLRAAVATALTQTAENGSWTLRRAFDSIINSGASRVSAPGLSNFGSASTIIGGGSVASILERAIAVGSPLYDSGDIEGCRRVYLEAARQVVSMEPALAAAIAQAEMQSADAGAWTLRRAFDAIIGRGTTPSVGAGGLIFDLASIPWQSVDDRVMGGISQSTTTVNNGIVNFRGYVTTQSNGGFSTTRANTRGPVNLSQCRGISFETRGDGQRYQFEVSTTPGRGQGFPQDFYPTPQWSTQTYLFAGKQSTGGRFGPNNGIPGVLNPATIFGFGLRRSAFLQGLQKDPNWRDGNFNVEVRGVRCI